MGVYAWESRPKNSNILVVPWKKVDLCSSAGRSKSLRFLWDNAKQHVSHLQWAWGHGQVCDTSFFDTVIALYFSICLLPVSAVTRSSFSLCCTLYALRASCATGRRRVSTLWLQWQRRRFRWVQNHGAADVACRLSVFTVIVHLFD